MLSKLKRTVDFIDELSGNKFHIIMFCGTHQGTATDKHFDYYLGEYTFRFNQCASHYRGKLFYRLIQNPVIVEPTTYDKIINIEKWRGLVKIYKPQYIVGRLVK